MTNTIVHIFTPIFEGWDLRVRSQDLSFMPNLSLQVDIDKMIVLLYILYISRAITPIIKCYLLYNNTYTSALS